MEEYILRTLKTERLIIREWKESDTADLYEFSKNHDVEDAGCKSHENMEESLETIRSWIEYQDTWAVSLKNITQVQ